MIEIQKERTITKSKLQHNFLVEKIKDKYVMHDIYVNISFLNKINIFFSSSICISIFLTSFFFKQAKAYIKLAKSAESISSFNEIDEFNFFYFFIFRPTSSNLNVLK